MFKLNKISIGKHQVLSIRNDAGVGFELVPERGGVLNQIFLKGGLGVLRSFEDEEDLSKNPMYKQTLLFPFPNRLKEGEYEFQGIKYTFPINEASLNNALHGFVYDMRFKVEDVVLSADHAAISLKLDYPGDKPYYPFPFQLKVTYRMDLPGSFQLTCEVQNTGSTELPCAFGWHPYFQFIDEGTYDLKVPVSKKVIVDDWLLPTGEKIFFDAYSQGKELTDEFDTCFELDEQKSWSIELRSKTGIKLKISSNEKMRFFQIYNPDDQTVAIEPVSCNVNAFRTGDGLRILGPGENVQFQCRVRGG